MPPMDPARWRELSALLDAALDLDPNARAALVASARQAGPDLAASLDELLAGQAQVIAKRFLEAGPDLRELPIPVSGQTIGAYTLQRPLGAGGMGAVWLGRRSDGRFEGSVAIKLLNLALLDERGQARFRREGSVLARLSHPNIARLLDAGVSSSGQPYLVLEYVDGQPIDVFADARRLGVDERVRLILDVLDAVGHAHAHLIVHRDLKPSNILVSADGTVKLLDFGIATLLASDGVELLEALTRDGRALTPDFAAPEQIRGGPVLVASDIYSLGVLLYLLVSGRRPYALAGRSAADIERVVCESTPPRPSTAFDINDRTTGEQIARARDTTLARLARGLRGDIDTIVMKTLRHEPERRYATVAALRDDLWRFLNGHAVLARADSAGYRLQKFVGRHRTGVTAAAVSLALLAGGVVRERTLRTRAEAEATKAKTVEQYLVSVFDVANPFAPPQQAGADVSARALLDRGAAHVDSSLSSQPEIQAELRAVLGTVYVNLGALERAEPLLRAALAQQRALHGDVHADVAAAMDRLGDLLRRQSRFDEAEPLLREALAQRRRLLGNAHGDTAASMDHLATLFQERTEFADAEALFREAVAVRRTIYGPNHEAVAASLNNLGVLLYLKARDPQAEPLYREALAINTRKFGADHPETAATEQNLAQTLQESGRLEESEALYRNALAAKRKALGDAHPSVTISLNNFAFFLATEQGRLDEAEALARQALALDRQMFAAPHAFIAESLRRLGTILRLKGDFAAAEQTAREALAMNRTLFGAHHLRIASCLNLIATTLHARGDLADAITLFRESLAQYEHLVGTRHINYFTVSNGLAAALRETGRPYEAEPLYRNVLGQLEPRNRVDREHAIAAQVGLGLTLAETERATEALPLVERAVVLSRERFGPDHWRTGEAELAQSIVLTAAGQPDRAEPLLRQATAKIQPHQRAQPRLALQVDTALTRGKRVLHGATRR